MRRIKKILNWDGSGFLGLNWVCLVLAAGLVFSGCSATPDIPIKALKNDLFANEKFETEILYATPEILRAHEANLNKEYLIGPGDRIHVTFWNREELTGDHVVGPFGVITLPMLGEYRIREKTRKAAAKSIEGLYSQFYENPIITVSITQFLNNKVYVLGRVTNPGVVHFDGNGTLLEALALAGGLPTRDKSIFLSKCSIIRGKDQIIWVNLVQLLQKGNLKLNVKLRNNDIIFIPESMDAAVFVMGESKNPGAYQIQTSGLSLLDAINLAGGPTENADIAKIRVIRNMQENNIRVVNLNDIIHGGDYGKNFLLKDDDIIYIPKRGIAKFNYYLRQIHPLLKTFISGALLSAAITSLSGD